MFSSSNIHQSCDVETNKAAGASLSDTPAAGAVPAHIAEFLSFQSELTRSESKETASPRHDTSPRPAFPIVVLTPANLTEGVVAIDTSEPEMEVQPSGSSSTPVHIVDVESVLELMPPPSPAKREIVLGL
ncbi:Uncharacterized protein Rs2_03073 [Raphanus sativus]|nr:Uncharacterized protein Rs2_03073 [Raphanus sativus]